MTFGSAITGAVGTVTGGFGTVWGLLQAAVKAGLSTGALQAVTGAFIALMDKGDASDITMKKHCALAVANIVEYEPGGDNVQELTQAIARLTFVLEQELKLRKEREDAAKTAGQ